MGGGRGARIFGVGHAVVDGLTDVIDGACVVSRGETSLVWLPPVYEDLLDAKFLVSTEYLRWDLLRQASDLDRARLACCGAESLVLSSSR